jgi:NADH-quinone oxidoreductase subunit N
MGSLGTIYVSEFPKAIAQQGQPPALYIGMLCMIAAFGFKIAAAPFHMWAPDVYQGAPTPTTAFLSTGPKVAGVAVLMRLLFTGFSNPPGALQQLSVRPDWVLIISVLSLLSMTVGNLVAMHQTNIKRMMAFSGISHMGYILLGVAAASTRGVQAVMFYLYLYTLTALAGWAVIILYTVVTGSEEIRDFAGLSRRSPLMAFVLMLSLLSLAGLPPLSGFVGKFYLFTAAWDSGLSWLVLAGILNSVASLFYYMGALKVVYWQAPSTDDPVAVPIPTRIAMYVGLFAILVLGLFPMLSGWAFRVATVFYGAVGGG